MNNIESLILCQGTEGPIAHDTQNLIYLNKLGKAYPDRYLEERDKFYDFYVSFYKLKLMDVMHNISRYNKWQSKS